MNAMEISDHMLVVGCDGEAIGIVDGVEGDRIRLAGAATGLDEPRYVRVEQVETVDDGVVSLSVTAMQARSDWQAVSARPQVVDLTH